MATKKVESKYPKIVANKRNGSYDYYFKLGETQTLKVKGFLQAGEFSDGYALVAVKDENGNKVYKFLGLNGKLGEDSFVAALPYSCGRALVQLEKKGPFYFRDCDGQINKSQEFDVRGTYPYKRPSEEETKAGLDVSNKLNLYGFAVVTVKGKETIANMMGETPNDNLSKKEVVNRGVQLYNFFADKLSLEDLDARDMEDPNFAHHVERLLNYKHNIKMIGAINAGNINEINALFEQQRNNQATLRNLKAKNAAL